HGEREQLLQHWSGRGAAAPQPACLHRLIESRALESPQALAVEERGMPVTYSALNARANRMARALAKRGVGANALVGLRLAHSADLLAAMLAAHKLGAACMYLDD